MSFKGMMAIIMVAQEKTPEKNEKGTDRKERKGGDNSCPLDGQKRDNVNKTQKDKE